MPTVEVVIMSSTGKTCTVASLVYYAVATGIILFIPWFRESYSFDNFFGMVKIAFVFIGLAIVPAVLSRTAYNNCTEEGESIAFISFVYYFFVLSTITIAWLNGVPDPIWTIILYPLFGILINFIPFGVSSWIVMIGCPTMLPTPSEEKPDFEIKNTKTGETYKGYIKDK